MVQMPTVFKPPVILISVKMRLIFLWKNVPC